MSITKEDVERVEREVADARLKMADLRSKFAEQECPLKVGDITDVVGWSHRGQRMEVTHILPPKYSFDGDWRVFGNVINKDGKPGKLKAGFSHKNWENRNDTA